MKCPEMWIWKKMAGVSKILKIFRIGRMTDNDDGNGNDCET